MESTKEARIRGGPNPGSFSAEVFLVGQEKSNGEYFLRSVYELPPHNEVRFTIPYRICSTWGVLKGTHNRKKTVGFQHV